jgi:tetratricopeptide (TPR) repeat protein
VAPSGENLPVASGVAPGPVAQQHGWLICLVILLLTWGAMGGGVRNGFVNYDDDLYLTANPALSSGTVVDGIAWAFTTTRGGNWHPLTWVSHLIDVRLFGLNPAAHHAVGLALHSVNALLLFALLRGLTGARWPSALVAVLFAVHPLHVESVAWAAERKDVLSTLFALAAALLYVRAVRRPGAAAAQVAPPLLFALALLAKPMPISLPLLLLLLDWWPLGRWTPHPGKAASGWLPPAPLLLEKAALVLLAAVSGVVTWTVQSGAGAVQPSEVIPLSARAVNALVSYARYLYLTIWPFGLAVHYPYPWSGHPRLAILLALGALAALAALAAIQARRRPWIAAGLLWYFVALLPVIGIVQVGVQALADRYAYLPLVGVFIAAAWSLAGVAGRGDRQARAAAAAAALIVAALCVLTARQVATWRDSVTLFSQAVAVTADNHIAHNNLGTALLARGRAAEALPHFDAAIRIAPVYAKGHLNRGRALAQLGRFEEAVLSFRTAADRDPDEPAIPRHLGQALEKLGRLEEALAAYRESLRLEPRNARTLDLMGVALARAGRPAEAVPLLESAAALDPQEPSIRRHLAVVHAQLAPARSRH